MLNSARSRIVPPTSTLSHRVRHTSLVLTDCRLPAPVLVATHRHKHLPSTFSSKNHLNIPTNPSFPSKLRSISQQQVASLSTVSHDVEMVKVPISDAYNFTFIEKKWQKVWEIDMLAPYSNPNGKPSTKDANVPFIDPSRPSFYSLAMFPYPSGNLHMGHVRVYTISDCLSRFFAYQGYNVLHPMGWDAFGLPAENAAIERGVSPADWTYKNIQHMRTQLNALGFKFQWEREVATCHPDYYKWTQWMFLQLYRSGLAYRKHATVNWDPVDQTVLANEQVDAQGRSWRSGAVVERKQLNQWFFRITAFAEDLLQGIDGLDQWPSLVGAMQKSWIGKRNSAHVDFHIAPPAASAPIDVNAVSALSAFTTRPDTIMGVTYAALLPTSATTTSLLDALDTAIRAHGSVTVDGEVFDAARVDALREFVSGYAARRAAHDASTPVITAKHAVADNTNPLETALTSGMRLPFHVLHPITGAHVPLFLADYVEEGRGTGVVMGVPAHDNNDCAFALQHHLPIRVVIEPSAKGKKKAGTLTTDADGFVLSRSDFVPYTSQQGTLINCAHPALSTVDAPTLVLDGVTCESAARAVADYLNERGTGRPAPSYLLHDWLVSRQRYWGTPIPVIYCDTCGAQPVPEQDLPVALPHDVPLTGRGPSPLASDHPAAVAWRSCQCPSCGQAATRETDTLDTFIDSSWYFLRFLSSPSQRAAEKLAPAPLKVRINANGKFEPIPEADRAPADAFALPWSSLEHDHMFPVTQYIGGIEHAILHLLYARFFGHFLHAQGLVSHPEPFSSLLTQGMVHGESYKDPDTGKFVKKTDVSLSKDAVGNVIAHTIPTDGEPPKKLNVVWEKMSKSKHNGVDPDDMVAKYGADVCRMFILFKAPPEKVLDWDERAVLGNARWLNRLHNLLNAFVAAHEGRPPAALPTTYAAQQLLSQGSKDEVLARLDASAVKLDAQEEALMSVVADTVVGVTREVNIRQFNVAIAKLMTLSNSIFEFLGDKSAAAENTQEWSFSKRKLLSPVVREAMLMTARLLAPIAPHFSAEMFQTMQATYYGVNAATIRAAFGDVSNTFGQGVIGSIHGQEVCSDLFDVHAQTWPSVDTAWITVKATTVVQINGKVVTVLDVSSDIINASDLQAALLSYQPFLHAVQRRLSPQSSADNVTWESLNVKPKRIICKVTKPGEASMINIVV